MYKKVFETITLYWCDKCTVKGTAGRWNKNHPTKAHTTANDTHHHKKEGKRKIRDRANTSTFEKRIRALEKK